MRRRPPYHVWVDVSAEFGERSEPGVLLAWRRTNDRGRPGWECLVMYAATPPPMDLTRMAIYQSWVLPHMVKPIDAELPKRDQARVRATQAIIRRGERMAAFERQRTNGRPRE